VIGKMITCWRCGRVKRAENRLEKEMLGRADVRYCGCEKYGFWILLIGLPIVILPIIWLILTVITQPACVPPGHAGITCP